MPKREPPHATVEHACAGRTRLRFAEHRGDVEFFRAVAHEIAALPGVSQVEGRPATGSLIVAHAGESDAFMAQALAQGVVLIAASSVPPSEPPFLNDVLALMRSLNLPSPGELGVKHAAAAAFLAMALQQAMRGNLMPPAATALWYAFSLIASQRAAGDIDQPADL